MGRGAMEKLRRGLGRRERGNADVRRRGRGAAESVATRVRSQIRRRRDAARGVDDRAWEARPPRKSVGARVTWGVRFQEASRLSRSWKNSRARCRIARVDCASRSDAHPETSSRGGERAGRLMKRGRTRRSPPPDPPRFPAPPTPRTIAREATRLLALDVPADQIRGVGV